MTDEELFDGNCPYTGKPCFYSWDCANCDVETEERLWMEEMDEEVDDADSD